MGHKVKILCRWSKMIPDCPPLFPCQDRSCAGFWCRWVIATPTVTPWHLLAKRQWLKFNLTKWDRQPLKIQHPQRLLTHFTRAVGVLLALWFFLWGWGKKTAIKCQTECCDRDVALTFSVWGKQLEWLSSAGPFIRGDKLITGSQTNEK